MKERQSGRKQEEAGKALACDAGLTPVKKEREKEGRLGRRVSDFDEALRKACPSSSSICEHTQVIECPVCLELF